MRRTKIVATLGPASSTAEVVLALAEAGADVFRLNFSHGSHADHATSMANIRAASEHLRRPLAILADLQGPKFRLGRFASGPVRISIGHTLRLDSDPTPGTAERVCLPHPEILAALAVGELLLVDDGKVRLRVQAVGQGWAQVQVEQGDELSDRKGVNVPSSLIESSPLTAKDRADLSFALDNHVDYVALSFVQRAADMAELRKLVGGRARVLAKIEKPQALTRLPEILDLCDAVMVARGDLGVELAPEDVPGAQKSIVRAARSRGVPVIVATQMLDSMVNNATPTRAEASDVAHAVYEGADAVMLSGETAAGRHPVLAVGMMDRIIAKTEADPRWPGMMDADREDDPSFEIDPISLAAVTAAKAARASCIVTFTARGASALRMARQRALPPILALTVDANTARRLALVWGVEAFVTEEPADVDGMAKIAARESRLRDFAPPNGRIVVVAGVPFGTPGATNLIRLARADS
jgi:pyruvate kinase